jgi:hypothetical protein
MTSFYSAHPGESRDPSGPSAPLMSEYVPNLSLGPGFRRDERRN